MIIEIYIIIDKIRFISVEIKGFKSEAQLFQIIYIKGGFDFWQIAAAVTPVHKGRINIYISSALNIKNRITDKKRPAFNCSEQGQGL